MAHARPLDDRKDHPVDHRPEVRHDGRRPARIENGAQRARTFGRRYRRRCTRRPGSAPARAALPPGLWSALDLLIVMITLSAVNSRFSTSKFTTSESRGKTHEQDGAVTRRRRGGRSAYRSARHRSLAPFELSSAGSCPCTSHTAAPESCRPCPLGAADTIRNLPNGARRERVSPVAAAPARIDRGLKGATLGLHSI